MTQAVQSPSAASWIQRVLASLVPVRRRFDPSTLADPMARQIAWSPVKAGGANFCTHKLVEAGPNRVQFRATLGAVLFHLVFVVVGAGVALARVLEGDPPRLSADFPVPLLFGSVFFATGSAMLYFGTAPIVFDKYKSCFWKGRRGPDDVADPRTLKHFAPLADVHALQILSELCSGRNGSYYSYELNLVLCDQRRINVVDHGNLGRLREDAQVLARFLGKPIWDALAQPSSPAG
jgi:hypothetical protein